jgi:putative ABC transport system permease protein
MWTRFRRIFGLEPASDVEHELAFHVDMRIRELIERGETPERARELTLRRFGDYEHARRECIEINERRRRHLSRREHAMEVRQDIVYALRMLRRTPGFTFVAVVTLALGIGANSAIFSVVHAVLLESLPFRDAERLYHVNMLYPDGTKYSSSSAPDFMSLRESTRAFEQVEAFSRSPFTLVGVGDAREVQGANVSDGLFTLLGLRLEYGRVFLPEENQPGRGRVTVLDHGFWRRQFGGAETVVGQTLVLGGNPYTIVGILAPGARLPVPADLYVPLQYGETFSASTARGRRSEFLYVLGRARPGVTAKQVDDDVRRIGTELQQRFPDTNATLTFTTKALRDTIVGDVRTPLLVVLGAVAFVLLVACANVANLLLARASVRQGELAVRAALGASRLRLLRQMLTESIVLGTAGGALGLGLAYWGTRALVAAQPTDIPRLDGVGVNGAVVLFTFAIAILTSVAVGVLPALQATEARLTHALREGGRGSGPGGGGQRVRAALVVAEMTLAVVLLMGAGLLIRSFIELTRVDPGFKTEQAIAFRIAMQGGSYAAPTSIRQRVEDIEGRLRALPGVIAVGATNVLPLGGRGGLIDFRVEGAPPPPPDVNQEIGIVSVTPGYFKAIGTALQRGRPLSNSDQAESPRVVLINEAGARFWFPNQGPIGSRVNMSGTSYEIVGIVADVLQLNPGQPPAPQVYVPHAQRATRTVRFVVRTATDPIPMAATIRAEIRALDANLPIEAFTPLEELVTRSVARPRLYTTLLSLFAGVALVLAATGIFGVMSYTVAQRSREISIRMALGAQTVDVMHLIAGRAGALAGVGLVVGIGGALALGRVIQSQLFGVSLLDARTLGSVVLVLAVSAAAASVIPVLRATRLDPASALREG